MSLTNSTCPNYLATSSSWIDIGFTRLSSRSWYDVALSRLLPLDLPMQRVSMRRRNRMILHSLSIHVLPIIGLFVAWFDAWVDETFEIVTLSSFDKRKMYSANIQNLWGWLCRMAFRWIKPCSGRCGWRATLRTKWWQWNVFNNLSTSPAKPPRSSPTTAQLQIGLRREQSYFKTCRWVPCIYTHLESSSYYQTWWLQAHELKWILFWMGGGICVLSTISNARICQPRGGRW